MRRVPLALLIILVMSAISIVCLSKNRYAKQDRDHIAEEPSKQHRLGTDDLGRDRAVRLAGALLLGMTGSVLASAIATLFAVIVGTAAAFSPSKVGELLIYISDAMLTLPWLFLLMIVRSALPLTIAPVQSAVLTYLLLALLSWPAYVRIARAGAAKIRRSESMVYARALGLRPKQLALRYTWPHLRSLALAQFVLLVPACLMAEANLGALGLGVSEPLPSYGSMLLALQHSAVLGGSYWAFAPIVLLVFVLILLEASVEA